MGASHGGEQSILVPQTTTACGGEKRAQQGCCFTTPPPPIECVDTHTEVSFLYAWCPPGLVTSQALFECRLVAVGYYPAQTADMACVSDLPSFHWSLLFLGGGSLYAVWCTWPAQSTAVKEMAQGSECLAQTCRIVSHLLLPVLCGKRGGTWNKGNHSFYCESLQTYEHLTSEWRQTESNLSLIKK